MECVPFMEAVPLAPQSQTQETACRRVAADMRAGGGSRGECACRGRTWQRRQSLRSPRCSPLYAPTRVLCEAGTDV
eukprot:3756492-Rhodomonas_salina.1